MTSSDDDLSWVLRRELNAEAARLAAAQDGLSQIREQLRSRPSVPVWGPLWGGLRVDAERYGLRARHLAAEGADWIVGMTGRIPLPGRRDRAEGRAGAQPGVAWLRPVLAVAAVCIFAGTAAAVPGLRHAITNIGSSGSGSTTSVTGKGGGSGLGTGQRSSGGNGAPGANPAASTTATPSPTATCTTPAKSLPSAKASPASSGGTAVNPTVTPAQSSPAATPTSEPASPTQAPTSPTGSSGPTPTDTSGAPLGTSGPPTESTHLSNLKPCQGPTLKGSAAAAAASQIPVAIPTPLQTRAQVEQPAVTPASSAPATPSAKASSGDAKASSGDAKASSGDPATPSATSTSSSGSPRSQGFETARACRHHPHAGCPGA
jgi:hypothetical protein